MDYIEIIVITFTQQAICSNWRRHINDRLRLGDAEPISGFNKAQVSCKFCLGPTLQKLESAANSTWALHYKNSSQLQILPGHYTTKWPWACLGLQQSSSQPQILPGPYTTTVAVGPSQLQILPGPSLERRQRQCSGGAVLKLVKWLVDLSTRPGRHMNFSQSAPAYKHASLDKLVSKHAALRALKRGGLLTSAILRLRTKTPP